MGLLALIEKIDQITLKIESWFSTSWWTYFCIAAGMIAIASAFLEYAPT